MFTVIARTSENLVPIPPPNLRAGTAGTADLACTAGTADLACTADKDTLTR